MEASDWIQLGTSTVLFLSVIISFVYYAKQTKKLEDSVIVATYSSLRRDEMELDKIMLNEYPQLLKQCFIKSDSIDDASTKHFWITTMVLDFFENLYLQRALIEKATKGEWDKWESYMSEVCTSPMFAPTIEWGKNCYDSKFMEFIENARKGMPNSC